MQLIRHSLSIIVISLFCVTSIRAQFAGGAGTIASPYQVNTLAHLNTIAGSSTYWDKHFIQTGNIDASATSTQNSGAGFAGIGSLSTHFTGSYNGQNYSITGMFINWPSTNYVGMFVYLDAGAVVKDLSMVNASITGYDFVGGIVSYADNDSELQNLTVDAQTTVTGHDLVGGIVGEARNAALTGCTSGATVSGNYAVGGIAGECLFATTSKVISGCSSSGLISATSKDVGGLVGVNSQTVTNCSSSATVNCTGTGTGTDVGGLIGWTNGPVSLCYSTGTVTGAGADVGGLVGVVGTNGSLSRCYSRATVESALDNAGVLAGTSNGNVTNCFTIGSARGTSDVGGLLGVSASTCTVSYCYAASKVLNSTDKWSGGLIGDNSGSEANCFWIDLFSDDNVSAPDEQSDFDADFKIASDVDGATKDFPVSAVTGSNAATTMSAFDFSTIWETAPAGAPGSFPVLRNMTAPTDAPAAPTKFMIASGNNKLTLSWASNYETDIASYKLYRSTTANFTPVAGDLLATVTHATGGLSFTDDGSGALPAPVNGTVHYYVLVAVDNSGNTSLFHRGAQIPAVNFANVSVSVVKNGVTYSDIHGSAAMDISAVYSLSSEGNITNANSYVSDGSGDSQGIGHPSTILGGQLTVTPSGLQSGQYWYFYYDDNTVAGNPIRNLTGGAGTGTTIVTGRGNTPVTVTADLDPDFTDYLFYVDPLFVNTAPSLNNITALNSTTPPSRLDTDVTATDTEASAANAGAGNYNGFSLVIQRQGGASVNDVLTISPPSASYVVAGGVIRYAGKQVASYSLVSGVFTLQFSGTEVVPTQAIVNDLLRWIKYYHRGAAPSQVTLDWTLSDGTASVTVSQLITGVIELSFYSGGSGDMADPWKIANLSDLADLSQNTFHWADYFIVTANINAAGSANFDDTDDNTDGDLYNDTNDGTSGGANNGFAPVGNITTSFTGNFDGQSYTISGLKINRAASDYLGLFGITSGAVIKNVIMTGVDITGDDETGGLIGKATNNTVTDCTVSGDVFGNDDNVGGLIGLAIDTDVSDCSFSGDVNGNDNTGGLIGRAQFASLTNKSVKKSWSTGTVTSDGDDVGGLIGEANYAVDSCYSTSTLASTDASGDDSYGGLIGYTTASVSNSHATGNVTASGSTLGGLIGEAQNCNITNCYATGNASGVNEIGGLIGFYDNDAATQSYTLSNCYARGNATGTGADIGGLIGENQLNVTRSYSTGVITGATFKGGFIGNNVSGTITLSFWDTQTSGIATSAGGIGKTTLLMKQACTYERAGWDFAVETGNGISDIWTMNATDNAGYPALSIQGFTHTMNCQYYSGGSGIASDPWQLSNLSDLKDLSQFSIHWADYFVVTANINASGSANFDDTDDNSDIDLYNDTNDGNSSGTNDGFSPIGNSVRSFSGNFNGQSYTISGLKINRAASDYLGLFGMTDGAIIKNIVLTNVDITGDDETGGLIGKATNNTVTDCTVSGDVFGNDDNVGGLIGLAIDTDVSDCSFAGDVNGNANTGGLIGQAQFASLTNKSIKKSWSTGTVTSDGTDVGGLIGEANYAVDSCYSTSTLASTDASGDDSYGGLIGYTTASVSNSHATGNVTASGSTIGGLIGEAENCNIQWCYATGNASGVGNIGGLIGFYDNNAAAQSYSVSGCYARGNATGTGADVGGLIGENQLGITRSYSTGSITGVSTKGGLVGNNAGGTATYSFWDTQTSGISSSAIGDGKNTAQMKSPCTYETAGWDMEGETTNGTIDVWTMNTTDNAGYPALSRQSFTHTLNCLDPFIVEWTISSPGSLAVNAQTNGNVVYYWSASPSGATGFGVMNKPSAGFVSVTVGGLAGDVITMSIESHNLKRFYINNSASRSKLTDVAQWGDVSWTSMENMFKGCDNLIQFTATDAPDLSQVTSMKGMFDNATSFNGDISGWDVSNVTDMENLFAFASAFNQDISSWSTDNVTTMLGMFSGASAFNQDIGNWNTENVTDMASTFAQASSFDSDISAWNTANVTTMDGMFNGATSFNQNIGTWNTGSVTATAYMFYNASLFNQDIGSWDVSQVTNMSSMFEYATSFNQDIGGWDVSQVTNMNSIFSEASSFNQDLSGWDVSQVTDMGLMFNYATVFDGDISTWNTSNVTNMSSMFVYASAFNQDISSWDVSQVTDMSYMFESATSFNQDISGWNTGNVSSMYAMFGNLPLFNQDISSWNTSSVVDMGGMFANSTSFNQNISGWDVDMVTDLSYMFSGAASFNQSLGNWTLASGADLNNMLDNCGMSCVNYSQTLIGWKDNVNTPSGLSLGASGMEYGTSGVSARNNLTSSKSWTITGDMAGTGACLPCPVLTSAPGDVTVVNSSCSSGCTLASGTITAPAGQGSNKGLSMTGSPCPAGSSIEYQVNGGTWTSTLPVYDQDGPAQTVKTRCTCDSDNTVMSPESAGVTTVPGVCTPPSPSVSGGAGICLAESATLAVSGTGSYTWSNSLGSNATVIVTPSSTSTYTVTATDSNGCTGTATATVTVFPLPTPSITDVETSGSASDDGNICAGAGVTVTGSGGADYLWSEGQTTASFFIRPYCTTSYELTVTDANGCTATTGTTVFVNYLPEIQTVSPTNGTSGTTVTITGRHLSDITDVLFNGIYGSNLTIVSSTEIRADLPSSGSLSDVLVVSPCGEASIDIAAPVITSFSPGAGPVGTLITVNGSHLDNLTSVTVGGVQAAVVSNNGSTLVIAVMPGSATGAISLTSGGGSVSTQGQFTVNFTPYPYFQQGGKRSGSNGSANSQQATSLAISTDGSTVVIGAPGDNSNAGAAWVFVKNGTSWEQSGGKLLATGATSGARMGASVAISLDGKTIALGAPGDNSNAGAVFIFIRNGNTWTQEGDKLTGTGAAGAALQGTSVALSGDGNTVVTGGIGDDFYNGAVWAFVRTDGIWAQQGSKMVSTGATGRARQGGSVAVSADGNTLITGGYQDDNRRGAVWIYTRTDCEWMQAGAKLVGTGGTAQAWQGYSVALSADGNTAISGASTDNLLAGAAWIFTRSGSSWSQQGSRLVGTHATSSARQGSSVAVSADGNTAVSGGLNDDAGKGAMWVFTRNGTSWMQQGSKLKGTGAVGAAKQGSSVAVNAIGTTALIGGPSDNGNRGAFWVYSLGSLPSVQKVITEDRDAVQTEWSLGQSFPNPSTGRFVVNFELPEACAAEWTVSDMSRRVVAAQKRNYPAGVNQEIFDLQNGTGVYYIQLKTPFGTKTGKHTVVGN